VAGSSTSIRLAAQTSTGTSALDGAAVSFISAFILGVATNLVGLAVTGDTGTLTIAIENTFRIPQLGKQLFPAPSLRHPYT